MEITPQYIAGFIDGEGYLGIRKHTTNKCTLGHHHHIVVKVAQLEKAKEPLVRIMERYGGTISKPRMDGNRRPCVMWELVNSKAVQALLDDIQEYLIVKQPQAELLREFIAVGKITTRIPDKLEKQRSELYSKREILYRKSLKVNRRGLAETE